jgi:hypothetical protein
MTITRQQAAEFIRSATADDLDDLAIEITGRRSILNNKAHMQFKVDDEVWFDSGRRGIIRGRIVMFKGNGKVQIAANGITWRVPGHALRKK